MRERRQVALIGGLFALVLLQAAAVARFAPRHTEIIILPFMAMLLTVLVNGRVSMIAAMILAIVIGLQPVFHDLPALFLCVVGGVTAALTVRVLRRRSNFYVPVLIIALGYLAARWRSGSWAAGRGGDPAARRVGRGERPGVGRAHVLPAAGRRIVTGITTDLTLLELSDPAGRCCGDCRSKRRARTPTPSRWRTSWKRPATGSAPTACWVAWLLLSRHREDQEPAVLRREPDARQQSHDRLKAHQSAQIIKAHVTDGLALAEEAGLPEAVAAFIPEHHGTTEITYFLDRAKKSGDGASRARETTPTPSQAALRRNRHHDAGGFGRGGAARARRPDTQKI